MERLMHQTRKTHNAHNETQRRLKKALSNGHTWHAAPHYPYIVCSYGRNRYVPDWANPYWSTSVHYNGREGLYWFEDLEEAEFARKHKFLVKISRSSGRHSYYRYAKKMMHKWWRRKGFGDATYSIRGSYCSWSDITY